MINSLIQLERKSVDSQPRKRAETKDNAEERCEMNTCLARMSLKQKRRKDVVGASRGEGGGGGRREENEKEEKKEKEEKEEEEEEEEEEGRR